MVRALSPTSIIQTLQEYATLIQRLDTITEEVRDIRSTIGGRLERMDSQLTDLLERLARLEAGRSADRAEVQADISRFKAEVDRAEMKLTKLLPESAQSNPTQ